MTAVLDQAAAERPRLRERHPLAVQLSRYVVAGGVGTLVNALLFLLLRTWWDLLAANLAALVLSTLVSTEVNRRFTFSGEQGHAWRAHVQTAGMVVFYAVYSSAVLLALHATVDSPTPLLESVTVAAASVLGGAARFLLLRFWVFDAVTADDADGPGPGDRVRAYWHGHRRTIVRVGAAVLAGTALLLSSAGACDPAEWGTGRSGY
ncbi:GtrA family protein [Pseudonocardia abyssalis]|uniref:GtrA family protein n=1 Tax=Pseudonocardia abyssalis TaxID=2792008 RepID=A0ABS6UV64_9PSEU|nr:GtrA family protein [Pseudonocardia abyssalis]MBW0116625.1 GtrA family protein [Pseudonocardia abyssalis]MBW0136158.1 GtrA family protein [Pseudonocardia abyssalis]